MNAYPALYLASDAAAAAVQRAHVRSVLTGSILVVLSALLGSFAGAGLLPVPGAVATAALLAASLVLSWVARARRWEKVWFDCRAVAESAKSATWRYMARASPFGEGGEPVDAEFVRGLEGLLRARAESRRAIAAFMPGAPQAITAGMRSVRQSPLPARRQAYLDGRLRDQRDWYARAARANARGETVWFGVLVVTQLAALVAALWLAFDAASAAGEATFTPVPVLAALAGAALAWTRTRRHADLSSAYGLATQELSGFESLIPVEGDEAAFGVWVDRVEGAISREHSMWLGWRA